MAQSFYYTNAVGKELARTLPNPKQELLTDVAWGDVGELFTPAYWVAQYWMQDLSSASSSWYYSSKTLEEEVVFCILGGFGITAEMAEAAFKRCNDEGLINDREQATEKWQGLLSEPLEVGSRQLKYRYPNQKSKFLSLAMKFLSDNVLDAEDGKSLRDQLLKIKGVGPKTASWIARNMTDTDDVAILDIHLVRACVISKIFPPSINLDRQYWALESRFLEACRAMGVRASKMDCLMWDQMRELGSVAIEAYKTAEESGLPEADNPRQQQLGLAYA